MKTLKPEWVKKAEEFLDKAPSSPNLCFCKAYVRLCRKMLFHLNEMSFELQRYANVQNWNTYGRFNANGEHPGSFAAGALLIYREDLVLDGQEEALPMKK